MLETDSDTFSYMFTGEIININIFQEFLYENNILQIDPIEDGSCILEPSIESRKSRNSDKILVEGSFELSFSCTDLTPNYYLVEIEITHRSGEILKKSNLEFIICGEGCSECSKEEKCIACKNGYSYLENDLSQCMLREDFLDKNYYRNPRSNQLFKCYDKCSSCSTSGDDITHNCIECNEVYPYEIGKGEYKNCYSYCIGENKCEGCSPLVFFEKMEDEFASTNLNKGLMIEKLKL